MDYDSAMETKNYLTSSNLDDVQLIVLSKNQP